MAIRAYFDESGTWDDPGVEAVAIGGCVASAAAWARFETDWKGVLGTYDVSRLHMRELSFGRGQFAGWTRERRESFLQELLALLRRDASAFVGAAIAARDFEALAPEHQIRLRDPYFACFQACVRDAAAQLAVEPDGTVLELVFDDHPSFRGAVLDLYEWLKRTLTRGQQLGGLSFASSIVTPQIQVADLMAYELRLFWQQCSRTGEIGEPKRYLMRELRDMVPERTFFHLFGPEALENWLRP